MQPLGAGHRILVTAQLQPVRQKPVAALGEHALRVELHAEQRQIAMRQRHHRSVLGPGGHDDLGGQIGCRKGEGMVSTRLERRGDAGEQGRPVVRDLRDHAVHEFGRCGDRSPERLADRLMPEAHTERRCVQPRGDPHRVERGAGIGRGTWSGREHQRVILGQHPLEAFGIDGIGLDHHGVGAELTQVSDECVHEAVVVVDHENSCHSTSTSPGAMIGLTHGNTYQNSP